MDECYTWDAVFGPNFEKVGGEYCFKLAECPLFGDSVRTSHIFMPPVTLEPWNKNQKWDTLRAMKTFIRRKVGHTT